MCDRIVAGGLSSILRWPRPANKLYFDGSCGFIPRRIDFSTKSCLQMYQPCSKVDGQPLRMWAW